MYIPKHLDANALAEKREAELSLVLSKNKHAKTAAGVAKVKKVFDARWNAWVKYMDAGVGKYLAAQAVNEHAKAPHLMDFRAYSFKIYADSKKHTGGMFGGAVDAFKKFVAGPGAFLPFVSTFALMTPEGRNSIKNGVALFAPLAGAAVAGPAGAVAGAAVSKALGGSKSNSSAAAVGVSKTTTGGGGTSSTSHNMLWIGAAVAALLVLRLKK